MFWSNTTARPHIFLFLTVFGGGGGGGFVTTVFLQGGVGGHTQDLTHAY